jgi:hypothetical protein
MKSMLDIQSYVSNPCNILQINWNNEKKKMDVVNDNNIDAAKSKVFDVISKSLKTQFESCSMWL